MVRLERAQTEAIREAVRAPEVLAHARLTVACPIDLDDSEFTER